MYTPDQLATILARFPRKRAAHTPTPLEAMPNLGRELGMDLFVKRDDCTGFGFGGNKVRQLEFYLGAALSKGADTALITGAVQSNFARTAAAMARRFGMECHVQQEERVPGVSELYRTNGNVLLENILGAEMHSFPEGENEAGADAAMQELAEKLRTQGRKPFVIPLGSDHAPLGALGYVAAAMELAGQLEDSEPLDEIVIASGSALTHIGALFGLRALGIKTPVRGVCVRREESVQTQRVAKRMNDLCTMLDVPMFLSDDDFRLYDGALAPGYGLLGEATKNAIKHTARTEGLFLDPVYTGKTMAGLMQLAQNDDLCGPRVLFWHTGGTPALFGYADHFAG